MKGYRCKACGKTYSYRRLRCARCGGSEFEEYELTGGTLITYTVLWTTPKGIKTSPLVLGLVRFEDGTLAFGQIRGYKELKVGMKVRPEYGELRESGGQSVYGYYFVEEA